jgi:hypothetical protein
MSDDLNDDNRSLLAAEYVLGSLDSDERTRAKVLLDVNHEFRGMVRIWERRLGELQLMVERVEPDPKIWERIKDKLKDLPPPPPPISMPLPKSNAAEKKSTDEIEIPAAQVADEKAADAVPAIEGKAEPSLPETHFAPSVAPREGTAGEGLPGLGLVEPLVLDRPAPEQKPLLVPGVSRRAPGAGDASATRTPRVGAWRAFAGAMTLIALGLVALIAAWRFVPNQLPAQLRPAFVLNLVGPQAQLPKKPAPGSQFEE